MHWYTAHIAMPFCTVDGVKIHYRESGHGSVVVLIHGFTGTSWNWALNTPDLERDFRWISVDLPGHGPSDKPEDPGFYSLENVAEVVSNAVRSLGIDKYFLVGHSMGGMIAGT